MNGTFKKVASAMLHDGYAANECDYGMSMFEEPEAYREDFFNVKYGSVEFQVRGVKRELGQTLQSTGLTVWRASDHLNDYVYRNMDLFRHSSILELGSGLGAVSILVDKLELSKTIVASDGDIETLRLLESNISSTNSNVISKKLIWGNSHDIDSMIIEYNLFDMIIGADIIYEESQIPLLLATVKELLKPDGLFIVAFARRNVPMNQVIKQADALGLTHSILEKGIDETEPIFLFKYG